MAGVQDRQAAVDVDSLSFPGVESRGAFARPLIGRKLTDTLGAARSGGRKHEGIDIFAPEGTPIHAVSGGTVVKGFKNPLGGNVVRIQGDDGRFYYYAHLQSGTFDHLSVGERVNAGQVIGGVGNTGNAAGTPNHLHLQIQENGEWINPFTFLKSLPELPAALAGTGVQASDAPAPVDPFAIDRGSPPSVADPSDADQDGLIDQFEAMFGTDPNLADTDRDALSDAYETAVAHTDPLSADTDRDGLTDGFEVEQGTDPGRVEVPDAVRAANFGGLATVDSDADGLSDAFEQRAGTDARKADTDRDRLSDGEEIARGSNPRSLDSDQDGLADDFEAKAGTLGNDPLAGPGVVGADPLGQDPLGQNPLGQNPLGQNPLTQNALGQNPLGQNPLDQDPLGQTSGAQDVPEDPLDDDDGDY